MSQIVWRGFSPMYHAVKNGKSVGTVRDWTGYQYFRHKETPFAAVVHNQSTTYHATLEEAKQHVEEALSAPR